MRRVLWRMGGLIMYVHVGGARAEPPILLTLDPPATAVPGERGALSIRVEGVAPEAPLMITARVLGESVELLSGRLLRADARASDGAGLSFSVPFVARAQGSSEITLELLSYACTARCEEVTREVSTRVVVRAP